MVAFEILHLIASLKTLSSNEGTRLGGRIWGAQALPPIPASSLLLLYSCCHWGYDGRVERNQPKGWKQAGDDPRGPCGPSTWEYHSALKTMGLLVSATVGGAWRTGGSVKENSQERIPWNEVSGGQVQRDRAPGAGGGATGSLSSVGTEV